jgi:hypothetical protein
MYIAKIFFPQEFIMVIENEKIIAIGKFFDSNIWMCYTIGFITSFITYWLYICATCRIKRLSIIQMGIVALAIILSFVINIIDANIAMHYSVCVMIALPWLFGGNIKDVSIVYSIHGLAQALSLNIRSLPMLMTNVNSATLFLCGFETYLWLLLMYIINNYYPEKEN